MIDNYGFQALHRACKEGYLDIIDQFLNDQRINDLSRQKAYQISIKYNKFEIIERLKRDQSKRKRSCRKGLLNYIMVF
jgi:ankyrin repeat protein